MRLTISEIELVLNNWYLDSDYKKNIENAEKDIYNSFLKFQRENLPEQIKKFFENEETLLLAKEFLKITISFKVSGLVLNEIYNRQGNIPMYFKTDNIDNFIIVENNLNLKVQNFFLQDFNKSKIIKYKSLKDEFNKTRLELRKALLTLKTYKKISESLPKIVKYLPKKENSDVSLNYKSLHNKL